MAGESSGGDILESGGRRFRLPDWRPSRGAEVLAVAALVIGLAAGYAAGNSGAGSRAAAPRPTVTVTASPSGSLAAAAPPGSLPFAASSALIQDEGSCAVQAGHDLQLGIQLTNESEQPVTLTTARAVLPLGGLTLVAIQWGTCGAISGGLGQGVYAGLLLPGASAWLAATFKVQHGCPAPLPVQFSVGYQVQGHSVTASLPGFPDLGQVHYAGCPAAAAVSAVRVEAAVTR